ncbi:helix-turn-helix domain-containing protein [Megamonas funiformis]|jgi:DNA-binding Xre family transcriptional regulator|uniref:helix-turn-helix domain-containing protein n=1 Tax=Megamonas funiformis TaxID=437897 RepID=UPI0040277F2A
MIIDRKKFDLAMAKKCINLKELKDLAHISNSTITKVLAGKIPLQPKTLGKIAKALEVEPADLLQDEA